MAILYSLVARGKVVLAEYTSTTGNFPTVTRILLAKISESQEGRMSIVYDKHVFHYEVEDGLVYLCMVDQQDKQRLIFTFLEELKKRFKSSCGEARAQTAIAFSLNEQFAPVLKSLMEQYNSGDVSSVDQLSRVKNQIESVKTIMVENIDQVLERGEKIELLVDKSEMLSKDAVRFKKQSRRLSQAMWWRRLSTYLIGAAILAVLILFISSMACGGLTYSKCRNKN